MLNSSTDPIGELLNALPTIKASTLPLHDTDVFAQSLHSVLSDLDGIFDEQPRTTTTTASPAAAVTPGSLSPVLGHSAPNQSPTMPPTRTESDEEKLSRRIGCLDRSRSPEDGLSIKLDGLAAGTGKVPEASTSAPNAMKIFAAGPKNLAAACASSQESAAMLHAMFQQPLPQGNSLVGMTHQAVAARRLSASSEPPRPWEVFLSGSKRLHPVEESSSSKKPRHMPAPRPTKNPGAGPAPAKRNALQPLHSLLCQQPHASSEQLDRMLREDPSAAKLSATIRTLRPVYDRLTRKMRMKLVREKYTYPLHLAIYHKATPQVITKLIEADPSVLCIRDGAAKETPLAVLLRHCPSQDNVSLLVDFMLLHNPMCATVTDRHDNSVLHIAVSNQGGITSSRKNPGSAAAALGIIQRLISLHPGALELKNFHGNTPLDVCRERGVACSEEVAQLVWRETVSLMKDGQES